MQYEKVDIHRKQVRLATASSDGASSPEHARSRGPIAFAFRPSRARPGLMGHVHCTVQSLLCRCTCIYDSAVRSLRRPPISPKNRCWHTYDPSRGNYLIQDAYVEGAGPDIFCLLGNATVRNRTCSIILGKLHLLCRVVDIRARHVRFNQGDGLREHCWRQPLFARVE